MFKRYISLYYSSIALRQSFFLFTSLISSIWLSPAKRRKKFHDAVKNTFKDTSVYTFTSGRGALAACLKFAGIQSGDEVLLSSFTCLAVPTAVLAVGAKPIYVDIDPESLNVKPKDLLAAITNKTKAVVIQHTFGCASELDSIIPFLKKKGLLVIEDCALALGSNYNRKLLGSFADAAIFSLELSKTLSTGWGGILLIRNSALLQQASQMYNSFNQQKSIRVAKETLQTAISSICHNPAIHFFGKYVIYLFFKIQIFRYSTPKNEVDGKPSPDFICKLSGTQASFALLQWKKMPIISYQCNENAKFLRKSLYEAGFKTVANPILHQDLLVSSRISFLVNDREVFKYFFEKKGIETGTWFDGPLSPLPNSPDFNYKVELYPQSYFISKYIVNIPCHSRLTETDLKNISESIKEYGIIVKTTSYNLNKL